MTAWKHMRRDVRDCKPCSKKLLKKMQDAMIIDKANAGKISFVISSYNEPDLENTLGSIVASTDGPIEMMVVDDASRIFWRLPPPEAAIRNARRIGSPRCRQLGCVKARGDYVAITDAHMRFNPGQFRTLTAIAEATGGWAYAGCNSHKAAELRMMPDGLLYAKWFKPEGRVQTSAMMGACYVIRRDVLMRMGGWIGLPGYLGSQELAMSILAARHNVPITVDTSLESWHQFREDNELPYRPAPDLFLLNMAATYRLLFDDPAWAMWRKRLAQLMPESILRSAESPELLDYGQKLRARFVVSDKEFMERFGGLTA